MKLAHGEVGRQGYAEPQLSRAGGGTLRPKLSEAVAGAVGREEGEGEGVGGGEGEGCGHTHDESVASTQQSLIVLATATAVSEEGSGEVVSFRCLKYNYT